MTDPTIDAALQRAEDAVRDGKGLKGTGFWKVVGAARRDRAVADVYADRMAAIDRAAFERGVRARVPASVGITVLLAMTAFGVVALVVASRAPKGLAPVAFLVGFVSLILGTHSLAHWIVGRLVGIRFTHVFLGGPPPPRPGMKTDYATYLRTSPTKRAVMHASGAVVTKLVPFVLIPVAAPLHDGSPWLVWILLAVGVVQIVTDVVASTKISDWMKVKRELRAAKTGS